MLSRGSVHEPKRYGWEVVLRLNLKTVFCARQSNRMATFVRVGLRGRSGQYWDISEPEFQGELARDNQRNQKRKGCSSSDPDRWRKKFNVPISCSDWRWCYFRGNASVVVDWGQLELCVGFGNTGSESVSGQHAERGQKDRFSLLGNQIDSAQACVPNPREVS